MNSVFRSLKAVWQLARAWWSVDRIRIAPTTGRLLQLQTGDSIVLLEELYTVRHRHVVSSGSGDQLSYLLVHSDGQRALTVVREIGRKSIHGEISIGGSSQTVFDGDVVVLCPASIECDNSAEGSSTVL